MYEAFKFALMSLVLPPGGPIVLVAAGVLAMPRYPRAGRACALAGAVVLWLCSLPFVAGALVTALGGTQRLDMAEAKKADAIVILGGGVRERAIEYGGDTLGRLTLERVRYGAFLARQTGLPILVTGGAPEQGVRAEAELMQESLRNEYGLVAKWIDPQARNSRENARNAAAILAGEGKRRIVLVLHGFDVRRVRAQFEAAGLSTLVAPTFVPRWGRIDPVDFLPSVGALSTTHYALYEILGLLRDAFAAYGSVDGAN